MDTKHPTYIKINNTFDRVMDEISKFEKVFQPGGKLEQAIVRPPLMKLSDKEINNIKLALIKSNMLN